MEYRCRIPDHKHAAGQKCTHTPEDIPVVVLVGQVDTANNDSPVIFIIKMTLIRKRGVCVTVSSSN